MLTNGIYFRYVRPTKHSTDFTGTIQSQMQRILLEISKLMPRNLDAGFVLFIKMNSNQIIYVNLNKIL